MCTTADRAHLLIHYCNALDSNCCTSNCYSCYFINCSYFLKAHALSSYILYGTDALNKYLSAEEEDKRCLCHRISKQINISIIINDRIALVLESSPRCLLLKRRINNVIYLLFFIPFQLCALFSNMSLLQWDGATACVFNIYVPNTFHCKIG